MRLIYSLLLLLALPAIFFRLWLRGAQVPGYRKRWGERLGLFNKPSFDKPVIWVHTVSVGEFIAARPMLDKLLQLETHALVITTTTPTGSDRVQAAYGHKVFHVYAPYDFPLCLSLFLEKTQPCLAIFLETELWPNILHSCYKRHIPTLLANARLSQKSLEGYQRIRSLSQPMMRKLTQAAIQNTTDADRFMRLGLPSDKAEVIGSIKFDININETLAERAAALKQQISAKGTCDVWIAASTHRGEDEIILEAFNQLRSHNPNARLILVPRHPDRFDSVNSLCLNQGFHTLRRSLVQDNIGHIQFDILLGDTMGELMLLFGCADVAFVGGSLVKNGGHNTIEPAVWGLPIISGPSQFNFAEVSQLLMEAHALIIINSAKSLATQLIELLGDSDKAQRMGAAAKEVAHQNQGALKRLLGIIHDHLQS